MRTRRDPPAPPVARRQPLFDGNVLLICIDTLRADALGAMGHRGGLTANLDALAARSALFRRAYAQGANTPQSFPSVFTSLYPTRVPFTKRFTGYPPVAATAQTVFETLHDAGVVTAAVTSHFYFVPERGITQGVADWDNRDATNLKDSNKDIAAPRIVPRAIAKLRELAANGRRFALFVHLFEPHSTYVKHREYPITERGVAGLRQKYDFEVKYVDQWLGKLLQGLQQAGLQQRTAIIVFSDHGEAFGEHKFYFHGQALYNEVLHVPLLVHVPGQAPQVVDRQVPLLDVAPTMLELFNIVPPGHYQGRSLLPLVRGERPGGGERAIGAVLMPYPAWPKGQQALLWGRYKALQRVTENRFELYDLSADPREQRNLALIDAARAAELRARYAQFVEEELN